MLLLLSLLLQVAAAAASCQLKGQTKGNATIAVWFAGFVVSVTAGCVLWAHFGCLITHVNQASKQRRHAVNLCVMAAKVVGSRLAGVVQQVRLIAGPKRPGLRQKMLRVRENPMMPQR